MYVGPDLEARINEEESTHTPVKVAPDLEARINEGEGTRSPIEVTPNPGLLFHTHSLYTFSAKSSCTSTHISPAVHCTCLTYLSQDVFKPLRIFLSKPLRLFVLLPTHPASKIMYMYIDKHTYLHKLPKDYVSVHVN